MITFEKLTANMIPCIAHHKGLSYIEVKIVSIKGKEVFFSYKGDLLAHHSGWVSIKHFVVKIGR